MTVSNQIDGGWIEWRGGRCPVSRDTVIQPHFRWRTRAEAEKTERAAPAITLAYGLLWHMAIDRSDPNLALASDARRALLSALSKDDQFRGISLAKATDARLTGAA